jgi:hypothetical protein
MPDFYGFRGPNWALWTSHQGVRESGTQGLRDETQGLPKYTKYSPVPEYHTHLPSPKSGSNLRWLLPI